MKIETITKLALSSGPDIKYKQVIRYRSGYAYRMIWSVNTPDEKIRQYLSTDKGIARRKGWQPYYGE